MLKLFYSPQLHSNEIQVLQSPEAKIYEPEVLVNIEEFQDPHKKDRSREDYSDSDRDVFYFNRNDDKLGLIDLKNQKQKYFYIDFLSPEFIHRLKGLQTESQLIKKAIGLKPNSQIKILDATAGLGTDAFIMAALGYRVLSVEISPIIFLMLQDAQQRCLRELEALDVHTKMEDSLVQLYKDTLSRLRFMHQDVKNLFTELQKFKTSHPQEMPDVIYLDPMYPDLKKSAQPKKSMQFLRKLLGPSQDIEVLLSEALKVARLHCVLKSHPDAPLLSLKSQYEISSKAVKYLVYRVT